MNGVRLLQNVVRPFSRMGFSFTPPSRIVAAALVLLCLPALAQVQSHFAIYPGQSSVSFLLAGSHEVKGVFHITSGDINFDRTTGHMSGKVVVDAAAETAVKRAGTRR